jgi:hypothetical protein
VPTSHHQIEAFAESRTETIQFTIDCVHQFDNTSKSQSIRFQFVLVQYERVETRGEEKNELVSESIENVSTKVWQ